jgi:pyrimidine oxygenase
VGTYALFNMIIGESDAQAWEFGQRVIAEAGAIGNIITSASTNSNEGGTADHLEEALSQDFEVGNMAFMGFPTIYGSVDTVASKIDEIAAETGVDGMLFSWADFVPYIRDFGE